MTLMEPEQLLAWVNPDSPETKKRTQPPQQGPRGPFELRSLTRRVRGLDGPHERLRNSTRANARSKGKRRGWCRTGEARMIDVATYDAFAIITGA